MAPITSPLPGGLAPSNGYPDPNSNYMQGNTGQQYMAAPQQPTATMYNPAMGMGGQQPPVAPPQSTINYQNFQPTLAPSTYQQPTVAGTGQTGVVGGGVYYPSAQPMDGGAMQQQQQPPVAAPAAPEPPKQKPPLPEQYVFMQTVFEELKKQCVASAGNPVRWSEVFVIDWQIQYFNENSVFYIFFLANETEAGRCLETARNVVRFAARESGKR